MILYNVFILQSIASSQCMDFPAEITVVMEYRGKNNIIPGSFCSVTVPFCYGDFLSITVEKTMLWRFTQYFKRPEITCTSGCFSLT